MEGFGNKFVPRVEKEPAPETLDAAYAPSPELIEGLARSFQLPEGATEQEVARTYLDSLAQAETTYGAHQGTPEDLLPLADEAGAFKEWAQRMEQES